MNLAESFAIRPILYWVPMYFVFKTVFIIWRKSRARSWRLPRKCPMAARIVASLGC
jgi:hypothetical protein